MVRSYSAATDIDASADNIWAILVDAHGYPDWDPAMDHIEGTIALGESVKFFTKVDPDKAFAVKVTAFEPATRLVLTGGMPLGLFKSERTHTLTPNQDGTIKFHTEEIFSGLMLSLIGSKIPDLTENFEQFVAGLKREAEGQGVPQSADADDSTADGEETAPTDGTQESKDATS